MTLREWLTTMAATGWLVADTVPATTQAASPLLILGSVNAATLDSLVDMATLTELYATSGSIGHVASLPDGRVWIALEPSNG